MNTDVLGIMQSPTGHVVKVVLAAPDAIGAQPVTAFPTLTDNIIVAVNTAHLTDVIRRIGGDEEAPSMDDIDNAMLEFVEAIIHVVQPLLDNPPTIDPFDLNEEGEQS